MTSSATQDDVRRNNLSRLLRRVHGIGPVSRSQLTAETGLNRSTVGALVSELAERGLVTEGGHATGTVGRPSLMVAPVPSSAVVLALDLRVDRTVGAVVGLGGHVFARRELRHPRRAFTIEAATKHLVSLAHALLDHAPEGASWVGTGVSVPGPVDEPTGRVFLAPNLGWEEVALGPALEAALVDAFGDAPHVLIGNDADLGALAETLRGSGAGRRNVVFINADIGVGGGIVIDGHALSGGGGFGGEVGHMVVNPEGAVCRCGRTGCWETEIGRDGILRSAGRAVDAGAELGDILRDAQAGDAAAREALGRAARFLGIGLANLANVLDPDALIVGGHLPDVIRASGIDMGEAVRASLGGGHRQIDVTAPALNGDSSLIGASELAFRPLLADPAAVIAESGTLVAS